MTIDPELRKLERAAFHANRALVTRLEGYGELVPALTRFAEEPARA